MRGRAGGPRSSDCLLGEDLDMEFTATVVQASELWVSGLGIKATRISYVFSIKLKFLLQSSSPPSSIFSRTLPYRTT